jgi:hypothetical protein
MSGQRGVRAVLGIWTVTVVLVGGTLMVQHVVAMPAPTAERVAAGVPAWVDGAPHTVVHVVPDRCSCTHQLLDHLVQRGPLPGLREVVVLSGPLPAREPAMRQAGFDVQVRSPPELADTAGIRAGPLLVHLDGRGQVDWSGGYYATPALVRPRDLSVLAELARGGLPAPVPVFGCAIDPMLRDQLDPIGLGWLLGR